ncbi:MAG: type IV pilus modification protein PilV [Oceanospirillales bacterium]|nr:type IV pilus modification protein PilV [Oceanospirillales bacterium]
MKKGGLKPKRQSGFTMIEVLVALLILLIGLLGVVGMQYLSLKQVNNTHLRSQVAMHAQSMVELIRANDGAALDSASVDAWEAGLVQDVPTASGAVNFTVNGSEVTAAVTVTWDERSLGNDADTQSMTVAARVD